MCTPASYQPTEPEIEYTMVDGVHYILVPIIHHIHHFNQNRDPFISPEVFTWCINNLGYCRNSNNVVETIFRFECKEDAMAFKLRWC